MEADLGELLAAYREAVEASIVAGSPADASGRPAASAVGAHAAAVLGQVEAMPSLPGL